MAPGAPPLILASGSAARRTLLAAAGLRFTVQTTSVDEAAIKSAMMAQRADPAEAALSLADEKARQIREPDALVIGADQILVCDGCWFDKPVDQAAARSQLRRLRGQRHELLTAVTCWRAGARLWRHLARPSLVMRSFSDAFLDTYLAAEGDAVLGSVGAYRLEGLGMHLFEAVEGDHASILGLPMLPLLRFLRETGVIVD